MELFATSPIGVLVSLAVVIVYFIRAIPKNRGEPGQKDGYVAMGSSSSALLQLDPRGDEPDPARGPSA
jgi:hypothetical protein